MNRQQKTLILDSERSQVEKIEYLVVYAIDVLMPIFLVVHAHLGGAIAKLRTRNLLSLTAAAVVRAVRLASAMYPIHDTLRGGR